MPLLLTMIHFTRFPIIDFKQPNASETATGGVLYKNVVSKNFAKLTGKQLRKSLA